MASYSIKDISHLSGIKAHTIRIWEQRYNILNPNRSATNIRSYSDKDLKLIINIAMLKNHGYKISKIADMPASKIDDEVNTITAQNSNYDTQISKLIIAMVQMDEAYFEQILADAILKLGFESTILNLIYPFLSRIGVMWLTGSINPAQEHFVSNLIRQKIIVAIDSLKRIDNTSKKIVLFLPEGEYHEINLLFTYYMLKKREFNVVYLGCSVPLGNLSKVIAIHAPQYVMCSFIAKPSYKKLNNYLTELSEICVKQEVWVNGPLLSKEGVEIPSKLKRINSLQEAMELINSIN